jgi:hypothetical protein
MLWMFATCLVLAQHRWYLSSSENLDATDYWYFDLHALLYSPLQGAGLAALILFSWRRLCGGLAFPTQPGHWYLVILGAHKAFAVALEYVQVWIGPQDVYNQMPAWIHRSQEFADYSLKVGLSIAAAMHFWTTRAWRLYFLAMTLDPLCSLLHSSLFTALGGGHWILNELGWSIGARVVYSLPAVIAVAAAIADWRRSVQRDLLHWVGVAVMIALAVIEWPIFVLWRYLFR